MSAGRAEEVRRAEEIDGRVEEAVTAMAATPTLTTATPATTTADTITPDTTMAAAATAVTATAVTTTAVRYYPVAPGVRLNVRRGPGTNYALVRVLPEGARIPIYCQTPGTTVTGPYGTSNIWDNIDDGEYVSDAYVNTGSDGYVRPRCSF